MDQPKKTYYVSIAQGEISRISTASPWDYKIEATDDEITKLREYFDQNYSSEVQGFLRAHVPIMEYHNDPTNDAYDDTTQKIYTMLYELGDNEAKEHIKSQGIIENLGHETKSLDKKM